MRLVNVLCMVLALSACGGSEDLITECTPGESVLCTGAGGCFGGQVCLADGSGFGACDCGQPDGDGDLDADSDSDGDVDGDGDSDLDADSDSDGDGDGDSDGDIDADTDTDTDGDAVCTDGCYDDDPCTADECRDGECVFPANPDGTRCSIDAVPGQCYSGVCCSGCWDGSTCRTGDEFAVCGSMGMICEDCDDDNPCTEDECALQLAEYYRCYAHESLNDEPCPGGQCRSDICEPCGHDGEQCCDPSLEPCEEGLACSRTDRCEPCGGDGEPCCDAALPREQCGEDLTCMDSECTHCGYEGEPCCEGVSPTCEGYLSCTVEGTCECGEEGEACCLGTICEMGLYCGITHICWDR